MPIPEKRKYTAIEFFDIISETTDKNELLNGEIVSQAAPNTVHQKISGETYWELKAYIKKKGGKCQTFISPYDVVIDFYNVVQPDVFIVCDPDKIDDKRCNGAPDFIVEVVSTNRYDDFVRKHHIYADAGVREYWIVDPKKRRTVVYFFEVDSDPNIYTFEQPIPVGIYGGELTITIADFI